jgi:hypothetical protein
MSQLDDPLITILETPTGQPRLSRRRAALRSLLLVCLAGRVARAGAAIWFDSSLSRWFAGFFATGFLAMRKKIKRRVDQLYLDKLDRKVSESFWLEKSTEWQAEQGRS